NTDITAITYHPQADCTKEIPTDGLKINNEGEAIAYAKITFVVAPALATLSGTCGIESDTLGNCVISQPSPGNTSRNPGDLCMELTITAPGTYKIISVASSENSGINYTNIPDSSIVVIEEFIPKVFSYHSDTACTTSNTIPHNSIKIAEANTNAVAYVNISFENSSKLPEISLSGECGTNCSITAVTINSTISTAKKVCMALTITKTGDYKVTKLTLRNKDLILPIEADKKINVRDTDFVASDVAFNSDKDCNSAITELTLNAADSSATAFAKIGFIVPLVSGDILKATCWAPCQATAVTIDNAMVDAKSVCMKLEFTEAKKYKIEKWEIDNKTIDYTRITSKEIDVKKESNKNTNFWFYSKILLLVSVLILL
ncbi:MAG: hypothetical protein ACRC42_04725, partial [Mycoplasma sp.]